MARPFAKPFYRSKEWQAVRSYVLMRDSYLCVMCGSPAEEVHHKIHLTPDNIYDNRVSLNPDNLVSLCRDCHFEQHRIDKLNGAKKYAEEHQKSSGYIFDDNGYLVAINEENNPPISADKKT